MFASIIIPTRCRPDELAHTLTSLGTLDPCKTPCEVIVVDNASSPPAVTPPALDNGWPVRLLRLKRNTGAAARNPAAEIAKGDWLLMLDDDSAPVDSEWLAVAQAAEPEVAAIGAEIFLTNGMHEAGGLPEVFVGCGALVRRHAFLEAGGYDETFLYYGEETDLCARLIAADQHIEHDRNFRVVHRRSGQGRNMPVLLERLTSNEALTVWRYAPPDELELWLDRTLARRRCVAMREGTEHAFLRGVASFKERFRKEHRRPLHQEHWDRLLGRMYAREAIQHLLTTSCAVRSPSGAPGKHAKIIEEELDRAGRLATPKREPSALVSGTLAPGIALDWAETLGHMHPTFALSPFAR